MITGRAHAPTSNKMSWENVNSWSQVLVVFFAIVALISGLFVSVRQGKEIASLKDSAAKQEGQNIKLQTAFEEQREKTAKSELALADVKKRQNPRFLDCQRFMAALKGKPTCELEILFQPRDQEAWTLAWSIDSALQLEGWHIRKDEFSRRRPIPDDLIPLAPGEDTTPSIGRKAYEEEVRGGRLLSAPGQPRGRESLGFLSELIEKRSREMQALL